MSTFHRAAVLAAASSLALALAACGSTAETSGPESAQTEQRSVLALLASDATGSLRKTAETTAKAQTVAFTMTGTTDGEPLNASGSVAYGDPLRAELTSEDPEQGSVTVRIIETDFYVGIPEEDRASMDGKKWFKMSFADAGSTSDAMSRQLDGMDPVQSVKAMLDGKDVTVVGEETIDGVPTVHYSTVNPVDGYLQQIDAELRKGVRDQLAKAGVTEVKTDVWVDEKYQPRRVQVVMGAVSDLVIDYTDYGKPVTVQAPPAGEVLDFNEMLEGLSDLANEN